MNINAAMDRAFELAELGPAFGPNPRVGCVLIDDAGQELGVGSHFGRGTLHAEAVAINDARGKGHDLVGATAVVTLEPCAHHGHTPPCVDLLLGAGIGKVVAAAADPNPQAAGGAKILASQGVRVEMEVAGQRSRELNLAWWQAVSTGRPYVSLKLASSLDGRVAASDGTSQWITGLAARAHVHQMRAAVDAIVVGMGTVMSDDPALTARQSDGSLSSSHQPLRVAVGFRSIPHGAAMMGPGGPTVHLAMHDPAAALEALAKREIRHVLLEGGARLASAWLGAEVVDRVLAYVAPVALGAGQTALVGFGVETLDQAARFITRQVTQLGQDVLIEARRD